MRILLDTHVLLWTLAGSRRLSPESVAAICEADDLFVSSVSFAEIGVKAAVGKLEMPDELRETVAATGVRTLALVPAHGLAVARLPVLHRDPFDRLLVAQARTEGLTIVTGDDQIAQYDVATVRA